MPSAVRSAGGSEAGGRRCSGGAEVAGLVRQAGEISTWGKATCPEGCGGREEEEEEEDQEEEERGEAMASATDGADAGDGV